MSSPAADIRGPSITIARPTLILFAVISLLWSATLGSAGALFQLSSYLLPLCVFVFPSPRQAFIGIAKHSGWMLLVALMVPLLLSDVKNAVLGRPVGGHDLFVFFWRMVVFPLALATVADVGRFDHRKYGRIFIGFLVLYAIAGLVSYTTGYTLYKGGHSGLRMDAVVGNPNPFGLLMAFGTVLLLAQRRLWGSLSTVLLTFGALGLLVLGTVLSGSRGAWLASVAGILVVLITRFRNIPAAAYALSTVVMMVIVAALSQHVSIMNYLHTRLTNIDTDRPRMHVWPHYLEMARHNLLLGHGTQTMRFQFAGENIHGSHDIYLEVLFRTGVPGLLLFLAVIVWLAWRLWRVPAKRPYLGLLAVLLVGGSFDYSIYGAAIFQSLLALVMAKAICRPVKAEQGKQSVLTADEVDGG